MLYSFCHFFIWHGEMFFPFCTRCQQMATTTFLWALICSRKTVKFAFTHNLSCSICVRLWKLRENKPRANQGRPGSAKSRSEMDSKFHRSYYIFYYYHEFAVVSPIDDGLWSSEAAVHRTFIRSLVFFGCYFFFAAARVRVNNNQNLWFGNVVSAKII